jgi:hypothetical protein
MWYLDVDVLNETAKPIEGATVLGYNVTGLLVFNESTDESGRIPTQSLIEYVQDATAKIYHSPYTIVTSKPGYLTDSRKIDLTESMKVVVVMKAVPPVIPAVIDIDPDTLNLKSEGRWITAYIEVPGYDVSKIDVSSVLLEQTVSAEPRPTGVGDYDSDGIPDLMVKFDRSAVQSIVEPGNVTLTISGKINGLLFEGSDTIRVINKGKS